MPLPYAGRPPHFTYIGGLTEVRGTLQMLAAISLTADANARLELAGNFQNKSHEAAAQSHRGWRKTVFHGWVGRDKIVEVLSNSRAGLSVLQPTQSYIDALPVKVFEYMAAGLPVITSDFPSLGQIIKNEDCGITVDPTDQQAIARAMDFILANPAEAEAMGERGRRAVEQIYNWPAEASKMIDFYHSNLGVPLRHKEK